MSTQEPITSEESVFGQPPRPPPSAIDLLMVTIARRIRVPTGRRQRAGPRRPARRDSYRDTLRQLVVDRTREPFDRDHGGATTR